MRAVPVFAAVMLLAPATYAQGPAAAPTVTLTLPELNALIQAENARAVATYITQSATEKATGAYAKVKAAFAPHAKEPTP